jgi:hypothetical protein
MTDDETLITLKEASEMIFAGKVSPATLKDQWHRGNLDLSKIGRSYFASVADFKGLKTKCLADRPARASGSIRKEEPGLSSTVEADAARDSLNLTIDRLKSSSGNTSQGSINKGGGKIPSADWDEIGPSPDDFFTLKRGQSALDAVRRAKEKWPIALINIPALSQSKD